MSENGHFSKNMTTRKFVYLCLLSCRINLTLKARKDAKFCKRNLWKFLFQQMLEFKQKRKRISCFSWFIFDFCLFPFLWPREEFIDFSFLLAIMSQTQLFITSMKNLFFYARTLANKGKIRAFNDETMPTNLTLGFLQSQRI